MAGMLQLLLVLVAGILGFNQVSAADTDIYFLHVTSDISFRFATTNMRSQVANTKPEAQEISFTVQLPKAAFIANFSMEIDGVVYPGDVKEKEQAKKQYEKAKRRGQSAGHVVASPRNTNKFTVSVNVAAQSKVIFDLVYQELLERRLAVYEHVININPGQVVRDLRITVNLHESREITTLRVPPIRKEIQNNVIDETATNERAVITRDAPNRATIVFAPSRAEQEAAQGTTGGAQGMTGQFVVQYDVARSRDGGEIQVVDGYFVHFISPSDVTVGDKAIIFILDISGSMSREKMAQMQQAMMAILVQLRPGDYFNMLKFDDKQSFWKPEMQTAEAKNIQKGMRWVERLSSRGATDINAAVRDGMQHLAADVERLSAGRDSPLAPLVIFLTDGQPSAGETNLGNILKNVKQTNDGGMSLFSLGFGANVDFNFLKKMALQNNGFGRKIYADSDAAIQLQGFYREVASPVLFNVSVEYLDEGADNQTLTKNIFNNYFKGTELVVAGSLSDITSNQLVVRVSGNSAEGPLVFNTISTIDGSTGSTVADGSTELVQPSAADLQDKVERMWAYLSIKEVLEKRLESDDPAEKERLTQRALQLSLRYNFVTPVTSMVVTKPDEEPVNEEVREEGEGEAAGYPSPLRPQPGRHSGGTHTAPPSLHSPGRGWADNDPHFMINVDGSSVPVCFDVQGRIGDIYQLLYDPVTDLTINGRVVGKPNRKRTYFGEISIIAQGMETVLDPEKITVNRKAHAWKKNTVFREGSLRFEHTTKHMLKVHVKERDVVIVIMRHLVGNSPNKVDFLGLYLEQDEGLSQDSHGLLGQFKDLIVNITEDHPSGHPNKTTGTMTFPQSPGRKSVKVYEGQRLNMATKQHVKCWYVRNNGRKLLDGKVYNYLVREILYPYLAPGLEKRFFL